MPSSGQTESPIYRRHEGKVLAVLGASLFQEPLIRRAQELGCTVHAFAIPADDVGEAVANVFHPISTADKETVLQVCEEIGADGICTIGSDFNNVVATWVANQMGLPANSNKCAHVSSDKEAMRAAFSAHGDPSPKSIPVTKGASLPESVGDIHYPLIVKPSDRSGSRGITLVKSASELPHALESAWDVSFSGVALVEEYLEGDEFSVECISWEGVHTVLQVTRKYTTGAPGFIETAHIEPPLLSEKTLASIKDVVTHALTTLGIRQGAAHAEIKVSSEGHIGIVEIGSRMGGDFIGSDLVQLSTGIDFVGAVIDCALGIAPDIEPHAQPHYAAVRFVLTDQDAMVLEHLEKSHPDLVIRSNWKHPDGSRVTDSSTRYGFAVLAAGQLEDLLPWLPNEGGSLQIP